MQLSKGALAIMRMFRRVLNKAFVNTICDHSFKIMFAVYCCLVICIRKTCTIPLIPSIPDMSTSFLHLTIERQSQSVYIDIKYSCWQ